MKYSDQLASVMDRVIGERSLRVAAREAGLNYGLLHDMRKHGWVPQRETLTKIADGFGVTGDLRREMFTAAGYIEDPQAVTA